MSLIIFSMKFHIADILNLQHLPNKCSSTIYLANNYCVIETYIIFYVRYRI